MNSNQNISVEHLSIWADTPPEAHMIKSYLKANPMNQWENEPLNADQQAEFVSGHFNELVHVVCRGGDAGSFGSISSGIDTETGHRRAVKLIKCKYNHQKYIDLVHDLVQREVDILERVSGHGHILQYYRNVFDPATGHAMIKTEFLEQTLSELVETRRLEQGIIVHMTEQLLDALLYLHEHKIVHRDLKPANIMLTHKVYLDVLPRDEIQKRLMSSTIKIIDLGIAKLYPNRNPIEFEYRKGSPRFFSPEKLNLNLPYDANSSDMYALGVTLMYLYVGTYELDLYLSAHSDLVLDGPLRVPNWLQVAYGLMPLNSVHCLEHIIVGLLNNENDLHGRFTAQIAQRELGRLPVEVRESMKSSFVSILDRVITSLV